MKANHKFFKNGSYPKTFRSSCPEVFCKESVLRNFTKFTGKQLCQSLFFNAVAGVRPPNLLKKRLWRSCFSVNFVKFLRRPFYIEHLWWLLLDFTSNIFELHEPKTGGKRKVWYNFPDLTRLKLPKISRTQKFKQTEMHKLRMKLLGRFSPPKNLRWRSM